MVHQDTLSELQALLTKIQKPNGEIANNCKVPSEDAGEVSIHKAVDTARGELDKAEEKLEETNATLASGAKVASGDRPEVEGVASASTSPATKNGTGNNRAEAVKEVKEKRETLHELEDKQTACQKAAQEYHAEARQIVTNHRRVLEVLQKLQPVEPAPASKAGSNAATTATEAARGANAQ